MANEASPTKSVAMPALARMALTIGVPGFTLLLSPRMPWLRGMQPLWMLACEGGDDGEAAWVEVKATPAAAAALAMFGARTRESPYMGSLSARSASATSRMKFCAGSGRGRTAALGRRMRGENQATSLGFPSRTENSRVTSLPENSARDSRRGRGAPAVCFSSRRSLAGWPSGATEICTRAVPARTAVSTTSQPSGGISTGMRRRAKPVRASRSLPAA